VKLLPLAALALALLAAGCGGTNAPPPQHTQWKGPGAAAADGSLDVSKFNDFLSGAGADFAGSPISAVTEYLRLDDVSAGSASIVSTTPGEVRDQAHVVVTLQGLLDDSVQGVRYTIDLRQDPSNAWRLTDAQIEQRCQPGRGHQRFSTERCV
jgi:hypothetical protein